MRAHPAALSEGGTSDARSAGPGASDGQSSETQEAEDSRAATDRSAGLSADPFADGPEDAPMGEAADSGVSGVSEPAANGRLGW